jgi:lipoprotein-anchoring transpeptidase ErfK/SrfK
MRRAALATVLGAATVLASPLPALAAGPQTPPAPQPAPAPAPAPQPGKMSLQVVSKMAVHGRSYVLTGDVATVIGRVAPYVAGQVVRVRISTPGHRPAVARAKIAVGGMFKTRFRTRRAVTYTVYARHDATPEQAVFAAKTGATAVTPGKGVAVVLLKQGLRALGYPAGNGPALTSKLDRSVLAFRKTNGIARIYAADRGVYEMVFAGRGAFPLRYPKAGKHVEADLSRQVVVLADNGRPVATYPTSSGKPSTPTVLGHFHFYMKGPGTNAKGMYMSNYFIRGYAVHGYPEVPTYAASHGCLRIPNADAVAIFNQIDIGESIWVYP